MSGSVDESVVSVASIEDIKARLVSLVEAASENTVAMPVRLTHVGGAFAKTTGIAFEKYLAMLSEDGPVVIPRSKRKLAPFVMAYCSDMLVVKQDPPGIYFVSLLATAESNSAKPIPPQALQFHRAVWAAFIRPIEGGKRFLNLDRIGFTDAASRPSDGNWCEIQTRFVLGAAPDAAIDGTVLQRNIEDWAKANDIALSSLIVQASQRHPRAGRLEQLLDIIGSLPEAAAAGWAIPANVLRHLRDAR